MDEERENHFITMLGSSWDDARMAGLTLRLELDDGRTFEGVPDQRLQDVAPPEQQQDATGVSSRLLLDGTTVSVLAVRAYTVRRPG